jgi:hypothetical protein
MDTKTWRDIDERFQRRPGARASPVDTTEFDRVIGLGNHFIDPDYREFVVRYGGGLIGSSPIYGLRKAEFMGTVGGKSTAPEITNWFKVKRWPGVDQWLVFSIDLGGNPIGFNVDGRVWLSDQADFKEVIEIASGFEDYLLKWCLKMRDVE